MKNKDRKLLCIGMEFFASEQTWRLYGLSKNQWLIHSLPNGTYDITWRLVGGAWIYQMLEKYEVNK